MSRTVKSVFRNSIEYEDYLSKIKQIDKEIY